METREEGANVGLTETVEFEANREAKNWHCQPGELEVRMEEKLKEQKSRDVTSANA